MLNPDGTKTCPHCTLPLPTTSFYKISRKLGDGLSGYCRVCTRIRAVAWQQANPDKMKSQFEKQAKKRSDLRKAGLYPAERKRGEAEASRKWRQENPERVADIQRNYVAEKKERDLAYYRAEAAMSSNRRRAKKKGVPSDVTMADWSTLRLTFSGCAYCGAVPLMLDLDHIIPLHKGGYDVVGNIAPVCRICNAHKSYRDPREFAKEMEVNLLDVMERCKVRESAFPTSDGTLVLGPV